MRPAATYCTLLVKPALIHSIAVIYLAASNDQYFLALDLPRKYQASARLDFWEFICHIVVAILVVERAESLSPISGTAPAGKGVGGITSYDKAAISSPQHQLPTSPTAELPPQPTRRKGKAGRRNPRQLWLAGTARASSSRASASANPAW